MGFAEKLKRRIRHIIYKENASGEDLICYLRAHGAKIGENVSIYVATKTLIDKSSPWLLTIGDRVRISEGVKILTHDYAWSVLNNYSGVGIEPGQILGAQSAVEIGNNVFIGMNAVITRGVRIGDNVVIGAGSVVTKDCLPNSVYAGNPAKYLMSLEEYYQKRARHQFSEARDVAIRYKERFGKEPPKEIFREYFMLFVNAETVKTTGAFVTQIKTIGNHEACMDYLEHHSPMFQNYEAFLNACYAEN